MLRIKFLEFTLIFHTFLSKNVTYDIISLTTMMIDDYRLLFIVSISISILLHKILNACQN